MTGSFYIPLSKSPEERAFLVGITLPGIRRETEEEHLAELKLLARTADAEVVGGTIQSRTRIDGSTYVGEGKVEELARFIHDLRANLVIFDDDLSPAQARNIERRLNVNVIDRTELILDIFARRARTRQAKLQVEIAQLTYALPRLRRLWDHLSRQAGGIGTRGPGETQLEVDRRRVREKIAHLRKELKKIRRGVAERRKRRRGVFNVTLVGYTNAGKSTLLNRISGSTISESSQLFSTLDSTTRRVDGGGEQFLLTDTVGFIRKLPPHLVESFRATLLDVREADLLLHIVDIANPVHGEQIEVVNAALGRLLAEEHGTDEERIPTVLVLNKIDQIAGDPERSGLERRYPDAVLVSAVRGDGMAELLDRIRTHVEHDTVYAEVSVSGDDGRALAVVEETARVLRRRLVDGRMVFDVRLKRKDVSGLERAGAVLLLPGDPEHT